MLQCLCHDTALDDDVPIECPYIPMKQCHINLLLDLESVSSSGSWAFTHEIWPLKFASIQNIEQVLQFSYV